MTTTPRPWTLKEISESLNCLIDNRDEWNTHEKAKHIANLQIELTKHEILHDELVAALEACTIILRGTVANHELLSLSRLEQQLLHERVKENEAVLAKMKGA